MTVVPQVASGGKSCALLSLLAALRHRCYKDA